MNARMERLGITPGLIRISVGLEHPDDLLAAHGMTVVNQAHTFNRRMRELGLTRGTQVVVTTTSAGTTCHGGVGASARASHWA